MLAIGAVGMVSVVSHVVTPRLVELVQAYDSGDVVRARALHLSLQPVHTGMFRTQGAILSKAALALTGAPVGGVRLPLVDATDEQRAVAGAGPHRRRSRARMSHPHPDLGAPPPLVDGGLRVVALGGLGEIGRNMTVFEIAGRLLVVDCGVLFPEVDQPGIDLILPGLLLHPGPARRHRGRRPHPRPRGPPRRGPVPAARAPRHPDPGQPLHAGPAVGQAPRAPHRAGAAPRAPRSRRRRSARSSCEFFAVNHSIPDALAVAIRTQAGIVLHTGDFKMDQLPLDGRLTDLGGFARLGREGIDLLLSDSTNAEVPGFVTPEREIGPVVDEVVRTSGGRVIVACFASHVHRVQQVLDAAHAHGRSVAFVGRSMVRNMGVARDLGYLRVPDGLMIDMKDVEHLPASKVVLVSTGSQGEPLSALSRMANRSHHQIRIEAQDTVVLASSLIPGNENAVYRVINGLSRWGARVVHKGVAKVHVSGHAPAGELLYLLNATKPSNLMPVHGEWRHLRAHAELARLTGVPDERIVLAEDGVVVDLVDGKAEIVGAVPCGYVFVDGLEVGDVGESTLKDRRILGDEGFISVTARGGQRDRQDRRRAGHQRPRLHRRPRGLRAGPPADRGRARPGRGRGRRRRAGHRPGRPPDRRALGQRHLPPPPDDRPGGRRGLTPDRRVRRWDRCGWWYAAVASRHGQSHDHADPPAHREQCASGCAPRGQEAGRQSKRPASLPAPPASRRGPVRSGSCCTAPPCWSAPCSGPSSAS